MASALNLNDADILHPLGEARPDDWSAHGAYSVELKYHCEGKEMVFEYQKTEIAGGLLPDSAFSAATHGDYSQIIGSLLIQKHGTGFKVVPGGKHLDLVIRQNCYVIIRAADGQEIYFINDPEPIMLKDQPRDNVYFDLQMMDSEGRAYKPRDFPADGKCKQICFGARHLDGLPEETHPFGLHLRVLSCQPGTGMEDVYIDPDIRNPSY